MTLEQRVAIISGANGGLGTTVSRMFHQAGASVVLVGTQEERVRPLAAELGEGRALPVGADLSDPAATEAVVKAALDRFNRVDILLNLAGGFGGGTPVSDSSADEVQAMFNLNFYTAYHLSRAAIKPMMAQQWGRIVNVGSRDALLARANYSAYAISKAAVVRLTEAMAAELKPFNIAVNVILPGAIDTEANRKSMPNADVSKLVKPATIAETLIFLSGEHLAISGATIPLFEQL
jgi:NAD(P)-dependent dehydrogenase (short-subunit alcohol dehydrogenase family)